LGNPQRPVMAIVGGAKVSTKLDLLGNLVGKVDLLVIGGGMANTFLFAEGKEVGKSLASATWPRPRARSSRRPRRRTAASYCRSTAGDRSRVQGGVPTKTVDIGAVPADQMILDIGPKSAKEIGELAEDLQDPGLELAGRRLRDAPFDQGTTAAAKPLPRLTQAKSFFRSRAAAIPSQRSPMQAWSISSPMSRPRAAPSSNGWKARTCPAWRPLNVHDRRGRSAERQLQARDPEGEDRERWSASIAVSSTMRIRRSSSARWCVMAARSCSAAGRSILARATGLCPAVSWSSTKLRWKAPCAKPSRSDGEIAIDALLAVYSIRASARCS
jgi:hypothetical protein